jgi:phage tail sheath protein FI
MALYRSPGVYIDELPELPNRIVEVPTAIPAFLGFTEKPVKAVTMIASMADYRTAFGGPAVNFEVTVTGTLNAPLLTSAQVGHEFMLFHALKMYFANGGGPCYVISLGAYTSSISISEFEDGLAKLALETGPTLIVIPDIRLLPKVDAYAVYDATLAQSAALKDRFTLIDIHGKAPVLSVSDAATELRNGIGSSNLGYGAVYFPDLITDMQYPDDAVQLAATGEFQDLNGLTLGRAEKLANGTIPADQALRTAITTQLNAVRMLVQALIANARIRMAPSAAMAGVYTMVDMMRGVWKAPASVGIQQVTELAVYLNDSDQAMLNVDATGGKSINAIRRFVGRGIVVWGARTLDGNSSDWRYVRCEGF